MPIRSNLAIIAVASALLLSLTACGSESANAVKVTSNKTECTTEKADFNPGKQTFEVFNKGDRVTELYVLDGDSVLGEVENVGPGTSRTLTVNLKPGEFDLGCKPGQAGPFIRQPITVSGAADGTAAEAVDRQIDFTAVDYDYEKLDMSRIEAGQNIEFKMVNDGSQDHEFEILGPDGAALGEIAPTPVGKSAEIKLKFDKPGRYTYICDIDDHASRGMKGEFTVAG